MSDSHPGPALRALLPASADLMPCGEGDSARAYRSGGLIVLQAKSNHASRCLDTVARLSPHLAPRLPIPVPVVSWHTVVDGRTVIAYPALDGDALHPAQSRWSQQAVQTQVAAQLAGLLTALHRFPVDQAQRLGVPLCPFPFTFEADHLREGSEAALYAEDLRRVEAYAARGLAPATMGDALVRRLDQHLGGRPPIGHVLLHGELSADHLLFDTRQGRLSGVIDFNGVHVGRPAADLRYLYDSYGEGFVRQVLVGLPQLDPQATLEEVRFLHTWHLVARLLWALDHGDARGKERWRARLEQRLA